eukprot:2905741-Pyramimonas_sp.AAC.1
MPEPPNDLALFNQRAQIGVSLPSRRVAMSFASRDTWLSCGARSERGVGPTLDHPQRRHLDQLRSTQLALETLRQQDEQRRRAA